MMNKSQYPRRLLIGAMIAALVPAAAHGGVWRPLGPAGASISSIVVDRTDSSVLYAVSHDGKVLRSDDRGATWISRSTGIVGLPLTRLATTEIPGTIYLGTLNSGVFRSTNRGDSWVSSNTGLTTLAIRSLAIASAAGSIFATTPLGVFKASSDGGAWSFLGPPGAEAPQMSGTFSIAVTADGKTLYATTSSSVLYKSMDGGATWSSLVAPSTFVTDITIDPGNRNTVYAASEDAIYKSLDGANAWTRIFQPPTFNGVFSVVLDPSNAATVYAGGGPFESVFRSTDAGVSWNLFDPGLPNVWVTLAVTPDGQRIYAGTTNRLTGGLGVFVYDVAGPCLQDVNQLCLLGNRFRLTVLANDPRSGITATGQAIPQSDRYGSFSLPRFTGDPTFPEVIVKMADATNVPKPLGGYFWVFHTGLTDLQYTLTVEDLITGAKRTYQNDRSDPTRLCGGADTAAFAN